MIVIFGAGILGLFSGYNLLKKGKKVKIFDTHDIKGNSTDASVGMLAPLIEAKPGERDLFNLMLDSKKMWKDFQLKNEISKFFGLKENGSLMIGLNKDDKERLIFKKKFFEKLGFRTSLLDAKETLKLEPSLNSNILCSLLCKNQDQINSNFVKKYLSMEIKKMGGEIVFGDKIKKILLKKKKVFFNNLNIDFEKIIIACGAWSNEIISNSFGVKFPIIPLKGLSILLKAIENKFYHNLWFRNIYIAPRNEDVLAIGATEDDKGFDDSIRMDELYYLINSIWESFTKLEALEFKEIRVGLRPAVIDGSPIIGPLQDISSDIICNFGHYRHGILLAPISAEIVTKYVLGEQIPHQFKFFSPSRFKL